MPEIRWKLHLNSTPEKVFEYLSTDAGRKKYWAENSEEKDGIIHFSFINGQQYKSKIIKSKQPSFYVIEYFNSVVRFELIPDRQGGTDFVMTNSGVSPDEYLEVYAGWLSVMFALKGAVDFKVDLRNHDKTRTWDQLYIEN